MLVDEMILTTFQKAVVCMKCSAWRPSYQIQAIGPMTRTVLRTKEPFYAEASECRMVYWTSTYVAGRNMIEVAISRFVWRKVDKGGRNSHKSQSTSLGLQATAFLRKTTCTCLGHHSPNI